MGTGGTLAGISTFMKEVDPDVKIGLADPMAAAMYRYFKTGGLASEGSSITEGIGPRGGSPIMSLRRRWTCPIRYPTKRRCRSYSIC